MDAIWRRIEDELERRAQGPQWLADRLQYSVQRVMNWKTRGVPANAHADLSAALGWSIDRLLGIAERDPLAVESEDEQVALRAFRRLPTPLARGQALAYMEGLATAGASRSIQTDPNVITDRAQWNQLRAHRQKKPAVPQPAAAEARRGKKSGGA